jgi:hypothetical protein
MSRGHLDFKVIRNRQTTREGRKSLNGKNKRTFAAVIKTGQTICRCQAELWSKIEMQAARQDWNGMKHTKNILLRSCQNDLD